jgi:C4-dicarboxylate-specific signal transduction histidine kinase
MFENRETTGELVDLNEVIRNVIALSPSQLERIRVIIREELADNLPQLKGTRIQLQQVILNLMLNVSGSINSMDGGSTRMTVKTKANNDESVQIEMQDPGGRGGP